MYYVQYLLLGMDACTLCIVQVELIRSELFSSIPFNAPDSISPQAKKGAVPKKERKRQSVKYETLITTNMRPAVQIMDSY